MRQATERVALAREAVLVGLVKPMFELRRGELPTEPADLADACDRARPPWSRRVDGAGGGGLAAAGARGRWSTSCTPAGLTDRHGRARYSPRGRVGRWGVDGAGEAEP